MILTNRPAATQAGCPAVRRLVAGIDLAGSGCLVYSPEHCQRGQSGVGRGSRAVVLLETSLSGLPRRRGKVRDVYDLGRERLLIVATDRISAFDWVLPTGIPDKGRVLTGL